MYTLRVGVEWKRAEMCTQGGSGVEEVGEVYTGWEWRGREQRCVHRVGVERTR